MICDGIAGAPPSHIKVQAAYNNLTCGGDPGDAVSKEINNGLTVAFARQLVADRLFPERRRLNLGSTWASGQGGE